MLEKFRANVLKLLTRHRQAGDDNQGNLEQGVLSGGQTKKPTNKNPECFQLYYSGA